MTSNFHNFEAAMLNIVMNNQPGMMYWNGGEDAHASNDEGKGRNIENGDGYITYDEAYWQFKLGNGEFDLFADINRLDLSKISASDFPGGVYSDQVFNFAGKKYYTNIDQALVYGNITLRLLPDNKVIAHSDIYDFDIKGKPGTFRRDVLTGMGYMYNGYGTSFTIHFFGVATINPK